MDERIQKMDPTGHLPEGISCRLYYAGAVNAVIDVAEPKDPFAVLARIGNTLSRQAPNPEGASGVSSLPGRSDDAARPGGVRDTSMRAYRALTYSGKLGAQQLKILDVFKRDPRRTWTRQELARETGLGINAICGRVKELMDEPHLLLVERNEKTCSVTRERVNAIELA